MQHLQWRRHALACAMLLSAVQACSSSPEPSAEVRRCDDCPLDDDDAGPAPAAAPRTAPRLFLTPALLSRLRARALANDPDWMALKQRCDGFTEGKIHGPGSAISATYPDMGPGYQGEEYLAPVMSLGLCYQIHFGDATGAADAYGTVGARLLEAMATPANAGGARPSTDSGYGIRNYGVGMAIGFDWLYPTLSATTRVRVADALASWIDWYDQSGLGRNQPIGNYFAGYLLAKAATALATEGDDARSQGYLQDIRSKWEGLVKPALLRSMAGGGWPEGWEYGPRAVRNLVEFLWAAKTAKNLDWILEVPQVRDQAAYLSYFAWPSLARMNDDGTVRSGVDLAPSAALASTLATILGELGDPSAARARAFAADVAARSDDRAIWQKFLHSDPGLPKSPYQNRLLSYVAPGPGHVAMRSSWSSDAVWAALSSGTYINAQASGEQMFNQGSLSIVVGDAPLLVNPTGWIPLRAGAAGEAFVYDDTWVKKSRSLYNTFFVADPANPYNPGQAGMTPDEAATHVARYEDGGSFVRARAAKVEQMYRSVAIREFTRDMVFLRPDVIVLRDRTEVSGLRDRWMAFHTAGAPARVVTLDASASRFDVSRAGVPVGNIVMLMPTPRVVRTVSLPGGVTRLEEHAIGTGRQQWLTAFTVASSPTDYVRLSPADRNVLEGNAVGVHVRGASDRVLLFVDDGANPIRYTVSQSADADHLIVDAGPSETGYAIDVKAAGQVLSVAVTRGGPFMATAQGTLCFAVAPAGAVRPCAIATSLSRD